jgi:hypothetical protein
MWHPINSAPYIVELELVIIDDDGEHVYDLPCRRSVTCWIDAEWQSPIDFKPTHWRRWTAKPNGSEPEVGPPIR